MNNKINLKNYDFNLPLSLIAQEPSLVRDKCRLFIYDTKEDKIIFDYFYNISFYLPPHSLIVFNNTKVLPARVYLQKQTGGKVEALFLLDQYKGGDVFGCLVNKGLKLGEKLFLNNKYFFEVLNQERNLFFLKFNFEGEKFLKMIQKYGKTPIPKYIKHTILSEKELRKKYQSIFAEKGSSIAAPTASLHFTRRVLKSLVKKKIQKINITLNVGLGTFAPVKEENIISRKLHLEFFEIPLFAQKLLQKTQQEKRPIIAVGTTTVRALESFALRKTNSTDLFIFSPFKFKVVDILITNFHLPKSSLLLLVDAFLKHKKSKKNILELYEIAIKEKFRFYSFGDAMLIL